MPMHESINYLEFAARDLTVTQQFFEQVFSWQFESYGDAYSAFKTNDDNATIDGGFYQADLTASADKGSVLVVFYSNDLAATQQKIEQAGGKISKPIFSFPGGSRFHFTEPSGNEFAVWSE